MNNKITYSYAGIIPGGGFGKIVGHSLKGLYDAEYLESATTLGVNDGASLLEEIVEPVVLGEVLAKSPFPYFKDVMFDYLVSKQITTNGIFHSWNNHCLQSLRRAKRAGATAIVERASAHPELKRSLIEHEYEKYNIDSSFRGERRIQRSIAELTEADTILVPSEFVKQSFLDSGWNEADLLKVPYGVDTSKFSPVTNYHSKDENFTALFAGTASFRKGIQYLLPAWKRADVDGELLVAGHVTKPARSTIDEFDDESIRILGYVDEMPELYRESSVFVFPTVEDGFGLVILEAMASGLPVITTSNAGAAELITHGEEGYIVEPGDAEAVAEHLETLRSDPDKRVKMGKQARSVAEQHTWQNYQKELVHAYSSIIY